MLTLERKICSKCGEEKSIEDFFWRSKASGKRRSACKSCWSADGTQRRTQRIDQYLAAEAAYREANRDQVNMQSRDYRARHHDQILERESDYREANRAHLREYAAVWRENHRAELKDYYSRYRVEQSDIVARAQSRRRAAELGVESDDSTRTEVWIKSNGVCHLCYATWPIDGSWHVDHIHPLQPVEGNPGTDTLDNKAVACPTCNIRKGNRIVKSGAYA